MPSLRSCSRFKELGVFPDGLVYHRYAMNLKSQPPLNSASLDWKEIGDHFRQEINDYIGPDHGANPDLL